MCQERKSVTFYYKCHSDENTFIKKELYNKNTICYVETDTIDKRVCETCYDTIKNCQSYRTSENRAKNDIIIIGLESQIQPMLCKNGEQTFLSEVNNIHYYHPYKPYSVKYTIQKYNKYGWKGNMHDDLYIQFNVTDPLQE